jgi:hypothetical protein
MPRTLSALAAAVVFALVLAGSALPTTSSGLRGIVKTPRPVCLQDDPCEGGTGGIRITFTRIDKVKTITSGAKGVYKVALKPGIWNVTSPDTMSPNRVTPAHVRVVSGSFRRVTFYVDTGIR